MKNDNPIVYDVASSRPIEQMIYHFRDAQVILDSDIARLYGVETRRLNEQVKRNISRFPSDFMFQLTNEETTNLMSHFATSSWGGRRKNPFAFTELGVSMLSSVLKSETAIQANIQIMRAFASMRAFLHSNGNVFQRLKYLEFKQDVTDHKLSELYEKLEGRKPATKDGIFYDGQIFDAYQFVSGLIKGATKRIVLFDNYVDESVLTIIDKRIDGVEATIYTKIISEQLGLDLARHNAQYAPIEVIPFNKSHDRFLVIDDIVYHIGASLKDLGKKWFAFSLMNDITSQDLLSRVASSI
ncbi:MAG: ORF6N domain-containing protein [Bacteroidales bacterium]|nr:ORF6N domain-containing protein [Bacteroidales bacterium]